MLRVNKKYLKAMLLISVIFFSSSLLTVPSTQLLLSKNISKKELSATPKISTTPIVMEHVSFKNVSFKDTLTIDHDSIVSITDSNFTKSLNIYVRDNSQLILKI